MKYVAGLGVLLALSLYSQSTAAACYTVFKDGVAIFQSSLTPVDMSLPFSQTVPARFGEGATLVYQERTNGCSEIKGGPVGGKGVTVASAMQVTPGSISSRTATSRTPTAPRPTKRLDSAGLPRPSALPEASPVLPDSLLGVSSGAADHTIYTGPRGGQYYINSSGNKTYVTGSSARGGRR